MMLVTGANGSVGAYVAEVFKKEKLRLTDLDTLDICDSAAVRAAFRRLKPKRVLHLAAETDVDRCEKESDHAFKANAFGTENLAYACREHGAVLVYISTGAVFPGTKADPYTEYDEPAPVNVYGRSKLAGERAVRSIVERHFILRAGWMFGGGRRDKKFVYKILKLMDEKTQIQAVTDKFGTLTYGRDLLRQAAELLKTERWGTYHAAHSGMVTRFDVASELARLLDKKVSVAGVGSDAFPLPAPRGRSEALRSPRLDLLGINLMGGWKTALAEYVAELERVGVLKDRRICA